jgi:hypothetical protein
LPSPAAVVTDRRYPWQRVTVTLYGEPTAVRYKTDEGLWYTVCGTTVLRIVIVQTRRGEVPYRVYFCTDRAATPARTLETYASRWAIAGFNRDGKQVLGLDEASVRTRAAVLRLFPAIGWLDSLLVVWFAAGAWQTPLATPPVRPWYPHKEGFSFADILRAIRRALTGVNILAEARGPGVLHQKRRLMWCPGWSSRPS